MDILVVGEALLDIYCMAGGRPRRIDELGSLERHIGGAPTNFAVGCQRAGLSVALVTRVGQDPMGRHLLRLLADEGIDVSRIRSAANGQTGLSFVSVSEDGERSFDFYGGRSADMLIEPGDLGAKLDARVLHIGSNTLTAEPCSQATRRAVAMAREERALVSCDLNIRRYRWASEAMMQEQLSWIIAQCDWLKISDDEVAQVLGHRRYDEAATTLLSRGPKLVAITCGPDGAHLYRKGDHGEVEHVHHRTLATTIVDTTGAGDAFWAGCVAALLSSDDLQAAAKRGSECAAQCIGKIGAT